MVSVTLRHLGSKSIKEKLPEINSKRSLKFCKGDLGWENPLAKGKVSYSSILAWRIPWTAGPWGRKESDMTE